MVDVIGRISERLQELFKIRLEEAGKKTPEQHQTTPVPNEDIEVNAPTFVGEQDSPAPRAVEEKQAGQDDESPNPHPTGLEADDKDGSSAQSNASQQDDEHPKDDGSPGPGRRDCQMAVDKASGLIAEPIDPRERASD